MNDHQNPNNRGFTFVELLVVVAILTVVGGVIAGFLATSTHSYKNVSNEVDLQEEAQLATNQLKTLLLNAQAGINFSENEICIYNSESRYVVTWNEEEQRLYYKEETRKFDEDSESYTIEFEEIDGEGSLLAEYVDAFSAMADDSDQNIVVNLALHLTKGDRTYQANENITLRNPVLLNAEVAAIYAGDTEEITPDLPITPEETTPEETTPEETTPEETTPEQTVKKVTNITISLGNGKNESSFRPGAMFTLNEDIVATVEGTGLSAEDKSVYWYLTAGYEYSWIWNGTLYISSDAPEGYKISIVAVSTVATTRNDTYTATVQSANAKLYLAGDTTVNRGDSITIKAKESAAANAKEYGANEVTWSVSEENRRNGVTINNGILNVPASLNYNTAYTIQVTATLKSTGESKTFEVQVPKVSVQYAATEYETYVDDYILPMINITNGSSVTIYYKVVGIKNGNLTGFEWTQYGNDQTSAFRATVDISENTITLRKEDLNFSGWIGSYDAWVYWYYGTPLVNNVKITDSYLEVNNLKETKNITIDEQSYYIPIGTTNDWVKLENSDYWYKVSYVTVVVDEYNSTSRYEVVLSKNKDTENGIWYMAGESSNKWTKLQ